MPLSRHALDERVSIFLWHQWGILGVSSTESTGTTRDRNVIDPEALLLFTLLIAPREPRLFGEVLDWLRVNGRLMSVSRLRNLTRGDRERRLVGAALAWAGMHNPRLQLWAARSPTAGDPEPLSEIYVQQPDPAFAAWGFLWPTTTPSNKSGEVDPSRREALAFRLRLLFGVGARAEIFRFLLTTSSRERTTSEIAHAAGFGRRNVADALEELVDAGAIDAGPRGRARTYGLDRERWAGFLGIETGELPPHADWRRSLRALGRVVAWFDEDDSVERSPYLRASDARQLVEDLTDDLAAAGVTVPHTSDAHGADYWEVFERVVNELADRLTAPHHGSSPFDQ